MKILIGLEIAMIGGGTRPCIARDSDDPPSYNNCGGGGGGSIPAIPKNPHGLDKVINSGDTGNMIGTDLRDHTNDLTPAPGAPVRDPRHDLINPKT